MKLDLQKCKQEIVQFLIKSAHDISHLAHERQKVLISFQKFLKKYPEILNDSTTCPLLIIITGLWSSHYKKELLRLHTRFFDIFHNKRLFFEKCLEILFEHSMDLNNIHQFMHGSTVLHWLIAWDRTYQAVEFIKKVDTYPNLYLDINSLDGHKRTPICLIVARKYFGRSLLAEENDQALIEYLIEKNCNIFLEDEEGNTPLHYAGMKHDLNSLITILAIMKLQQVKQYLQTVKNKKQQNVLDTFSLNYSIITKSIHQVYNSSKVSDIIPYKFWQENKEDCIQYINSFFQ